MSYRRFGLFDVSRCGYDPAPFSAPSTRRFSTPRTGEIGMHTVELLEAAIAQIKGLGYRVRIEPLDGGDGGLCEFQKRRWLFLDAAASPLEQLHQVLEVLRGDPRTDRGRLGPELARLLEKRKAA
jgi:hypothetical protein